MFRNVFSRRKGYTPPPVQGKLEELSQHARNRLWDIFRIDVFQPNHIRGFHEEVVPSEPLKYLFRAVWTDLYHRPMDEFPGGDKLLQKIRESFLTGVWHFPFDIFEAIFESVPGLMANPNEAVIRSRIRDALERENQAYTFVGDRFVERMTAQEVESVETGLQSPIEGIRVHFAKALKLYSDRDNPDFPNSIKESISAVEAACKELTGLNSATLGQALNALHRSDPCTRILKTRCHTFINGPLITAAFAMPSRIPKMLNGQTPNSCLSCVRLS
jgi:hypothetical protein